jgi:hypothetical protein
MANKDESYMPMLATGCYPVRGGACWAIKIGKRPTEKGKRQRYKSHTEKTREAAEAFIQRWNKDIREKDPVSLNELTRKQKAEIIYSLERLDEIGVSLRHAIDTYIEKTNPISLKMRISACYEKFEEIQRSEKVDKENINHPRSIFKRLIKFLKDKPIGLVTKKDIREFLNSGNCSETTKKSYLRNLNVFFNKLKREGLSADNPCDGIKISSVTKISKGYEAWELYVFLNECLEQKKWRTLTAFVFTAFFGLRLKESTGLLWENMPDIESKDGFIDVQVEIAKTKRRRTLYVSGAGKTWLNLIPVEVRKGPLALMHSVQDEANKIRKICKNKYPHFTLGINQARQAFAANHFAKHRDIEKLRMLMGNSPAVIVTNYNGLVKNKEEEIYWRLFAPNILTDSLDKAIDSKLWKGYRGEDINQKDYIVVKLFENVGDRRANKRFKEDRIAVKNEKINELNLRCKVEGYSNEQANAYIMKVLRAARKNNDSSNIKLAEMIIFERQHQVKAHSSAEIQKLVNVKNYLQEKLSKELTLPKVMRQEMYQSDIGWKVKPLENGAFVTEYRANTRWNIKSEKRITFERGYAKWVEDGSVMAQK